MNYSDPPRRVVGMQFSCTAWKGFSHKDLDHCTEWLDGSDDLLSSMDGLDRWGTHDAPPKTNFFPGPANGGNVSVRHLQCGRRAEKRSQRREEREREREERYQLFESRVEAEGQERDARPRRRRISSLFGQGERERGRKKDLGETREDARKTSAPRRRRQLWNTKESCDGARDVDPAPRPRQVSTAAVPSQCIRVQ